MGVWGVGVLGGWVDDWVRCERKKGEVLAVKYCRLTPTCYPSLYLRSFATVSFGFHSRLFILIETSGASQVKSSI